MKERKITDLVRDPATGVFLPGNPGSGGTAYARQRAMWAMALHIARQSDELKALCIETPQDVLLYIGMTGKWPGIGDIREVALDKDSDEYKKLIRANPWLVTGVASEATRMAALTTVMQYLMPKLSQVAFRGEDEATNEPTDIWAKAAAADPILRKRLEMLAFDRLPAGDEESKEG